MDPAAQRQRDREVCSSVLPGGRREPGGKGEGLQRRGRSEGPRHCSDGGVT